MRGKNVGLVVVLVGGLLGGDLAWREALSLHAQAQGPAGWTEIGAQPVVGEAWNFDAQADLAPDQTFVRVTVGSCEGEPGGFLMEGALVRQEPGRLGIDVWAGPLELAGTAAGVQSAVGHARISRPVVPNPISQVDVTLFGLTGVMRRALLHVCVRAP